MANTAKITDEIIKTCADNIRLGMSFTACAKAIGVTYQTWNRWQRLGAEGKPGYARWYIAVQAAESDLMKECLQAVKASMRSGDVKSAMYLLDKRFSNDGFGTKAQLNVTAQNQNLNLNATAPLTFEETEQIRQRILDRLRPKEFPPGLNINEGRT